MQRRHWIALAVVMLIAIVILAAIKDGLCLAAAVLFIAAAIKATEADE